MLSLHNIDIRYGNFLAVDGVTLALKQGEIGCLLGPSGCGKTSILRALAGFEPIGKGKIFLRNEVVSKPNHTIAPEHRHISVVFQDFALFPHMSVTENIAFGLHKWKKADRQSRVDEVLQLVGLSHASNRYPHELSGGQQQRIALARALAPKPELLLMDEPFSSLDAELREELAKDIRTILKRENTSALVVTHDQNEAFAIADVIGVLNDGKLHQWDDAYALYHKPATRFVADFVGNGVFLNSRVNERGNLSCCLGEVAVDPSRLNGFHIGQEIELLIRPDDVEYDEASNLIATVVRRSFRGANIMYELSIPGSEQTILCLAPSHNDHAVNESFGIRLDLAHLVMFAKPSMPAGKVR
ncbi:ABC transporter ATP-binding protein [Alteromonas ponticola]|uniref:ABC transporter ATP-binding protein n=1 Tax=Alteromonas aquimaris TaxID=2998417 RepID=A0ABT3P370_9ALTE|nr:ABC transporter ATP-binding protein [Alteromonas aquimaris]MCW8107204.1 ABC transporter ATP-binding protein [Alteromonas aquimaris]